MFLGKIENSESWAVMPSHHLNCKSGLEVVVMKKYIFRTFLLIIVFLTALAQKAR